MVNSDAKVYDGDTLIAESEGMYVVFYDIMADTGIKHRLERGTNKMHKVEFYKWLEDCRCIPRNRGNIDSMLKMWGLDEYNPLYIVQKTEGRMPVQDNIRIDLTNIVYK